jgi:F0F1-type ATP synthase assembly protein I
MTNSPQQSPGDNPLALYSVAIGAVGQVGCLLFAAIIGCLIFGLVLDRLLGTKPLFVFIFLVGSIPLNLWMIFKYTSYKAKQMMPTAPTPKKEETTRGD